MLEDPQFIEMLVKFLSSNMEGEIISHGGERSCVCFFFIEFNLNIFLIIIII